MKLMLLMSSSLMISRYFRLGLRLCLCGKYICYLFILVSGSILLSHLYRSKLFN